jgi:LysM repeat protein
MKRLLTLLQSILLLICICLVLCSCARERARTDIALEMTDEDSVEALIDEDLLTAGSTIVNIDEDAGLAEKSTVTYVDRVDMQKPVLVESDIETTVAIGREDEVDQAEFESGMVILDEAVVDVAVEGDEIAAVDERDTMVIEPVTDETVETIETDEVVTEDELVERAEVTTETAVIQPDADKVYTTVYRTETSVSYPRHTVKRGDTLWSISRDYDCSISELCAANNISRRDILRVGQTLVIPKIKKEETAVTEETTEETVEEVTETTETAVKPPDVETEFYTVKAGDSYWKISRAYGISVSELMALNDTTDDFLREGQKILVPKK